MATLGIDGLASGLDTTGIINQLISLERQPVTRLQQRISRNDAAISSLTKFSSAMKKIEDLAKKLTAPRATFMPVNATSSDASVAATASSGAATGSVEFTVDALAQTHRLVSSGKTASLSDVVATTNSTVRITVDGTDFDVDTGDGTLSTLITNINATSGLEVSAQAVNTGSGYKLQLNGTESGAASVFTVDTTNLDPAFATSMDLLQQGQDAQITMGKGTAGEYTVTSASNTFAGVLDNLSFTVSKADPSTTVTISVTQDQDALVQDVKALVDEVNSLLKGLDEATFAGKDGRQGSLSNDPTMRGLRTQLLNAMTFAVGDSYYGSAGLIGINSTREGRLEFNESTFKTALEERPADVIGMFRSDDTAAPGLAQRLQTLAADATRFGTGTFDTAIESRKTGNSATQTQIDAMEIRIELRRKSLQRQFASLETALSSTKAQGDWLASQLPALNANWARN